MRVNFHSGVSVFSGSLENGKYSEPRIIEEHTKTNRVHSVKTAEVSGEQVVIMSVDVCWFRENKRDTGEQSSTYGLRKASLRTVYTKGIKGLNAAHEWDRMALNKLLTDAGIIVVEPQLYIAKKIGDIRKQQRLDSFYTDRGTEREKTVHPIFSDMDRFCPQTLADHGWEHIPAEFESEGEAKASRKYALVQAQAQERSEFFLGYYTARDKILSLCLRHKETGIYSFEEHDSFPDGLDCGNSDINNQTSEDIKDIKEIQETPIFMRKGEPGKAAVVKLAGRQTYLITPEENQNELQFDTLPESELFKYFQDTWKDHIDSTSPKEFEQHTLATLRNFLPEIDTNFKDINRFIEGLSAAVKPESNKDLQESIQIITNRMTEFKTLYQELRLMEKQIEFYTGAKDKAEKDIDFFKTHDPCSLNSVHDDSGAARLSLPVLQNHDDHSFNKMEIACAKKNKVTAESKLQGLQREIAKIRLKIAALSELQPLLLSMAGRELGEIYSEMNDADTRKKKKILFEDINKMLGLIHMSKTLINSGDSRNIEALNLAVENELSNFGNTEPPVSGSIDKSKSMPVMSGSSQLL